MDEPTQQKVAVLKRIARAAAVSGDNELLSTTMRELSEYGVASWEDLPSSERIKQCIDRVEDFLQGKVDAARSSHMRKEFMLVKRNVMWRLLEVLNCLPPGTGTKGKKQ